MGFFGPGGLFKTRLDSYNIHHIFEGDSTVECTFGIQKEEDVVSVKTQRLGPSKVRKRKKNVTQRGPLYLKNMKKGGFLSTKSKKMSKKTKMKLSQDDPYEHLANKSTTRNTRENSRTLQHSKRAIRQFITPRKESQKPQNISKNSLEETLQGILSEQHSISNIGNKRRNL